VTIGAIDSGADDEAGVVPDHTEAFIQKGVIKGSIGAGSLTWNPNLTVSSLSGISLQVNAGTLEYSQTSTGVGNLNAWNLADRAASNGVLALAF